MSRHGHASAGFEKKLSSIQDFTKDLTAKLPTIQDASPDLLLADISQQISAIKALTVKTPETFSMKMPRSVEKIGRDLWNLCIRLQRDLGRKSQVDCRVRLLAFYLLELSHILQRSKVKDGETTTLHLLELSMTISRICLREDDLETGRMALQKTAELVEQLKALRLKSSSGDLTSKRNTLEIDYLTMRITLSWKENRLDVAEHMFSKSQDLPDQIDISSAEIMADTFSRIGSNLAEKKDFAMAIKWLRRAFDVINAQPLDQLSVEGLDQRMAITQSLIQSLMSMESSSSVAEANELISYIEGEMGDHPIVLHWRLEILQKTNDEASDPDSYASTLRRLIQSFDSTEKSLQFLLHHIQRLRTNSQPLADSLLDELLLQKVLPSSNRHWIEKVIVHKVWFSTMDGKSRGGGTERRLFDLLTTVLDSIQEPLNPEVAGAAQSLLWKKVESTMSNKQFDISDKWCFVALHDIFSNCGDSNKAKFGRKRILCALGLNNPDEARLVYASLPQAAQNDVLSRYLMFKVALKIWDTDLGIECIQYLSGAAETGRSQDMLYACIREAQQAGDKLCTVAALKAVAEGWDAVRSSASCLTSVLRCGIRLIAMLDDEAAQNEGNVGETFAEDTCKLFEIAAQRAQKLEKDQDGNKIFTIAELNWFRKNAYNIGVTKCTDSSWGLNYTVRIFSACVSFTNSYPPDIAAQESEDLAIMTMRCHFIIAAALVSQARTEDLIEERFQRYLEMRQHIALFQDYLEGHANAASEAVVRDLRQKLATLFVFDFEGAVALKSWDDLAEIVRKANICNDAAACKAMGDCLLRSGAPAQVLYPTLRLLINQIHKAAPLTSSSLSKYIRCLFQAILPLDPSLALQLLDQAIKIAQDGAEVGAPLPRTEMEWLVAQSFNHAVDCYARADEDLCGKWAVKAIELAGWMDDGGQLKGVLEGKFAKLRFEK